MDANSIPVWRGFNTRNLHNINDLETYLVSVGFVAASRYRGFAWTVDDYLDSEQPIPGGGLLRWVSV